ncbi:MAG: sugar phosphate isomerase/epimerase [Verrucomicrobiae bacterium]|nr:sugar phosphate isomerase/epimerase [Verrucomicrobiae bacterium]
MKSPATSPLNRRQFLRHSSAALLGGGAAASFLGGCGDSKTSDAGGGAGSAAAGPRFTISLAEWSLHNALKKGELDNLDFPKIAREMFGIGAVEWVNQFFGVEDPKLGLQPKDGAYIAEMLKRTNDLGVENVLIMCDRVGNLGDPNEDKRSNAVVGHFEWVRVAKALGCHSIRVNARSDDRLSPEEQRDLCVDGLSRLSEFATDHEMGVIVENHGGLSSNGSWLASVMKGVGMDNCGTLPDFGNFFVAKNRGDAEQFAKAKAPFEEDPAYRETPEGLEYDRYQGVTDLMPFAKGVSAKSHDFNDQGDEVHTDFVRMMKIVKDAGYSGHVGIEYEGGKLSESDGIQATKKLLEKAIAAVG